MSTTPVYSVDHFIAKFEAIPEDKWCEDFLINGTTGQRCAFGHCGMDYYDDFTFKPEAQALAALFGPDHTDGYELGTRINNGMDDKYFMAGDSPKARILAALHDIKAKETPKI